jgi:hypothetical protein
MTLSIMRANGVHAVSAACGACGHKADVNVDALPETVTVPKAGPPTLQPVRREDDQARMAYGPDVMACQTIDRMKSREEQLTWAKQRALICVDMGRFSDAVAGLRADLAENPLTKGVISSEHAMRGYKAAMDAALGRSSQALTEWIEKFR